MFQCLAKLETGPQQDCGGKVSEPQKPEYFDIFDSFMGASRPNKACGSQWAQVTPTTFRRREEVVHFVSRFAHPCCPHPCAFILSEQIFLCVCPMNLANSKSYSKINLCLQTSHFCIGQSRVNKRHGNI